MSLQFYEVLHVVALSVVLLSLGGASFATYSAGGKPGEFKKYFGMTHGIGVLVMLIAGFGMIAKLGISWPFPTWILVKIVIWFALGGWIAIIYKVAVKRPILAALSPLVLVLVAVIAATYKF